MYSHFHNRKGVLAPDDAMWHALENGDGLQEIITNFYNKVYEDRRLSHFFEGVTKQRAIEKQFSFMRSIFTGEKCYFGDHPKSAHHWMVISDDLFDHRESLMESCLIEYGLPDKLIKKWRKIEEVFRKAIVKSAPQDLCHGDFKKPAEGFILERLEVASLCDQCEDEILSGSDVICHIRTGKVYCANCKPPEQVELIKKAQNS